MFEPIFDITPPGGACKVRLRTLFKKQGGSPVITCDVVSQDAVQSAIDASESLGKYLKSMKEELGSRPWTVKAEMVFLGSDGEPIDKPVPVSFLFYGGKKKKKGKNKGILKLCGKVVKAQERIGVAQVQAIKEACTAGVKEAAGQAAQLLAAGVAPLEKTIGALEEARKGSETRANDATKDVATLLQQQKELPPRPWTEDFTDLSGAVLPWVPIVKSLFGPN